MRINPIITQQRYVNKIGQANKCNEPTVTESQTVSFEGKPLTKAFAGISGITAIAATIATGGVAALVAAAYFATCTAVGYCMDKENENSHE